MKLTNAAYLVKAELRDRYAVIAAKRATEEQEKIRPFYVEYVSDFPMMSAETIDDLNDTALRFKTWCEGVEKKRIVGDKLDQRGKELLAELLGMFIMEQHLVMEQAIYQLGLIEKVDTAEVDDEKGTTS